MPQAPTWVYLAQVLEASALVMRSGLLAYASWPQGFAICPSTTPKRGFFFEQVEPSEVIEQSGAVSQPGAVTIL